MRVRLNLVVAAAAIALMGLCSAPAGAAPFSPALSGQERAFLRRVSQSNLLQMQMEAVVARRSMSARDRAFARRQAVIRNKAEEGLEYFAAGLGAAIQEHPNAAEQRVIDRLGRTPRRRFNSVYRQTEIGELSADLAQTRHAAQSARGSEVRGYAKKLLPSLSEQLKAARALPIH
jgi:hypothetical protein